MFCFSFISFIHFHIKQIVSKLFAKTRYRHVWTWITEKLQLVPKIFIKHFLLRIEQLTAFCGYLKKRESTKFSEFVTDTAHFQFIPHIIVIIAPSLFIIPTSIISHFKGPFKHLEKGMASTKKLLVLRYSTLEVRVSGELWAIGKRETPRSFVNVVS